MCHPLLVGLNKSSTAKALAQPFAILDLHVDLVGGEVQKNILSILLWASAVVGELHCLIIPERLVASQQLRILGPDYMELLQPRGWTQPCWMGWKY